MLGDASINFSDVIVGRICLNGRALTLLIIGRNEGLFNFDHLRVFDSVLLTTHASADRLAAGNIENQFRKLYLGSPPSAHARCCL